MTDEGHDPGRGVIGGERVRPVSWMNAKARMLCLMLCTAMGLFQLDGQRLPQLPDRSEHRWPVCPGGKALGSLGTVCFSEPSSPEGPGSLSLPRWRVLAGQSVCQPCAVHVLGRRGRSATEVAGSGAHVCITKDPAGLRSRRL